MNNVGIKCTMDYSIEFTNCESGFLSFGKWLLGIFVCWGRGFPVSIVPWYLTNWLSFLEHSGGGPGKGALRLVGPATVSFELGADKEHKGHIDARIYVDGGPSMEVYRVYVNPIPGQRLNTWELLRRLRMTDTHHGNRPTKALRPDGFQAVFFQKFWHIVGDDVIKVCLSVLSGDLSIRVFNQTNIVLIPKKKNPLEMKDFRPISLCFVVYKIVTKCLANRLKLVLPNIIDPCQNVFVPGRLIFDNVLVAFEMLHCINKRKKGKKGLAAIKLDMSKTYDRAEWSLLGCVMEKLGFPHKWTSLVFECISSSCLCLRIMGKCFVKSDKKMKKNGKLLGIRCCGGAPLVSHLFFAFDNLLFCKASVQSGLEIKWILGVYENGLGQQWGSSNGKRKISWVGADRICLQKTQRGLRFKDLGLFNQALLAIQAWWLVEDPNSLVFRVLQATYLKRRTFYILTRTQRAFIHGEAFCREGLYSKKALFGEWGMRNQLGLLRTLGYHNLPPLKPFQ
ncbi:hypothetical protein Dsin_008583 [Dipteronia sinensis]|uniref:Reverse transcriptase domain-containing protein n=1 Tax=Dipteronia sinensis TaxID=43782 RepID=A0AAE0EAT2_9ROSI|nr:hypothetical protein Dsin_008583 [Dipteronia sinensis]